MSRAGVTGCFERSDRFRGWFASGDPQIEVDDNGQSFGGICGKSEILLKKETRRCGSFVREAGRRFEAKVLMTKCNGWCPSKKSVAEMNHGTRWVLA